MTDSPSNHGPAELVHDASAPQQHPLIIAIASSSARAIERLLPELPLGRGMAFLLVTPSHAPALEQESLREQTSLRLVKARHELPIEPDHVYLVPPEQRVGVRAHTLIVTTLDGEPVLPIDYLFRSLAEEHGDRAAAILLTGINGDGSVGAVELKAAGALVILQAPANASEASLPEHQLLAKSADLVVPLQAVVSALIHYFQPAREGGPVGAVAAKLNEESLGTILRRVEENTGHDFARYKRSTLGRRIQRRMRLHGLGEARHYLELLEARPAEAELLFNEMLIGVTNFFRDPESYKSLESALADYLARLPSSQDLRVWVSACSTGEEAYSIAILLHECVQRSNRNRAVKIFATDVDPKAVDFARIGRYPRGIQAYVSAERLERFFVQEDDTYRINKETRETIVFAPHNVIRDPPFTHVDLLSCRNLLIYLEPELQQQVLGLFEYALEPGGLLLLGGSESLGALHSAFEPLDKRAKLFFHRGTRPRRAMTLPMEPIAWGERAGRRDGRSSQRSDMRPPALSVPNQLLMAEFVPPSAIVGPSGELAYLHGRTGLFLEPPVGEPSTNVFDMAREGLKLELPAAVRSAHHAQQTVVRRGLQVRTNGSFEAVTVVVKPLNEPETMRGLLLVTFQLEAQAGGGPLPRAQESSNLEEEVQYVRSTMQGMVEDLQASNEELKSMNEELQSTNEEVQSTNEELSTSREELQSLNEELQTLNEELAQRNSMLSQSNDDMQNLLSSVQVATVFVDSELNVKRFTAPARQVFHLRDSDIGRPVSDLVVNLDYRTLVEDAHEVLRSLVFREREVQTTEGEWRLMRILPYRTANNIIDGLIITVTDVQRLKQAQRQAEDAQSLLQDLLASMPMPVVLLNDALEIVFFSVEFARRFGTTRTDLDGRTLPELGSSWGHPRIQEQFALLARGEPCAPFRLEGSLGGSVPLDVLVHPRRLRGAHAAARYVVLFQEMPDRLPEPINVG
jgi:two-component system, chemotaxis family, CheB/CheR fusion protein